jgi:regulator of protease activity HflC (stomatin/prohibitin superfamily)
MSQALVFAALLIACLIVALVAAASLKIVPEWARLVVYRFEVGDIGSADRTEMGGPVAAR